MASLFNPRKKRFWGLLSIIGMFALQAVLPPVRPYIQLPGEIYPGTEGMRVLGGWTNTFSAALLAWLVVIIIALAARARSRTADEVPSGFYNFIEMLIEAAYGFVENIAGSKARVFFPLFMSYLLIIVVSNWMGLLPGFDSIGLWENKPVFKLHEAVRDGQIFDNASAIAYMQKVDKDNVGDLRIGSFLLAKSKFADPEAEIKTAVHTVDLHDANQTVVQWTEKKGAASEAADWTIVPFFRPAATDLNMTLAFAVVAMVMVQYYGIKYLGARGYLSKFFPIIGKGWAQQLSKDKFKALDPAIGLLELVSEFSKIISFAFRLLGNIFAGMVLLFVMSFLLPAANIVFYGLEFFVGLIQGLVFALLMLIFMVSATESHHGDDHH